YRLVDGPVLGNRLGQPAGNPGGQAANALYVAADVADHLVDAAVSRLGVEGQVELLDQPGQLLLFARDHLAVRQACLAGPNLLRQLGQRVPADVQRGLPGARPLEQLPQLVDLAQVGVAVTRHDRAPVRGDVHEAVLLQADERVPQRRLAHAEAGDQLDLPQHRARRQGGADDVVPQLQVNGVLELPVQS